MLERFWDRHERTWVVILGPQTSGGHAEGVWPPARWHCHVHRCTTGDARHLPETRYPHARHVTIVELPDFLRLLKRVGGRDEQSRIVALDAACREHLGHRSKPGRWRFRDHAAPSSPALELARQRHPGASVQEGGERKAA